MSERETVYFASKNDDDYSKMKYLVDNSFSTEREMTGVEAGRVRLFKLAESVYKENGLKPGERAIFIGNIDGIKKEKKEAKNVFDNYGVSISWNEAGHAFIDIDIKKIEKNDVYERFFKDYSQYAYLIETSQAAKKRNSFWKIARNFIPFGFIKTIANAKVDIKIKSEQIHEYALLVFYCDYLKKFMEIDITLPESLEESKKDKKKKNKLEVLLQKSVDDYNNAYYLMKGSGESLYQKRIQAIDLIEHVKNLINSIANHPKDFDTKISEIAVNAGEFIKAQKYAEEELRAARNSAAGALAGAAGGAAISAVTPTAAMWVATTFGTASTGTAISSLSGAAATKAALAWLGGGAISAGGGGVAAGESLIALAGPIGIGVAAVTLLTTITLFELKKNSLNKKRKDFIQHIEQNKKIINEISLSIGKLLDETDGLLSGTNKMYEDSLKAFGRDFAGLDHDLQLKLGALVNNTNALAKSICKTI